MIRELDLQTHETVEFLHLTDRIARFVSKSEVREGRCIIYVPHTTAGVTINEGADPDVVRDMIMEINKIVPFDDGYHHAEGNSAAHIKASMMGSSATVLVQDGRMLLGTWQSIYFCEFDGPRKRRVLIQVT